LKNVQYLVLGETTKIREVSKMKKLLTLITIVFVSFTSFVSADTFGTGENAFTIDFVTISGNASSANGTNISQFSPGYDAYKEFRDPSKYYRMGTYEITNNQWNKFKAAYGPVVGTPTTAYDESPYFTGTSVPTNNVSWYEAAQFVNWLNTSTNHTAAYKFTGTQGTSNYMLGVWQAGEAGYSASNPYRNSNAYYFMPTEDEWVKAAYWNGTTLQTYATKAGESVYQGSGSNGGWNYYGSQPWAVGSGSQELNGTYDMMGNVWEWMESPWYPEDYLSLYHCAIRGGSYYYGADLSSSDRHGYPLDYDGDLYVGFRVASVPEPASLLLLGLAGLLIRDK
jgi:hypothetical protein